MDNMDFIDFIEFVEDNIEINVRTPKKYIRDVQNPFEIYSENEFKKRYRFSKETVRDILLPLVHEQLSKENMRGSPIIPIHQLFLALRFYATGDFQIVNGDLRGISQATVSRTIKRVSEILAGNLRNFIKYPDQPNNNMRQFFEIAHFPAVTSVIDGTHIPIQNPGANIGEIFRNRKGVFSLNVQVACGPNMEILDIVVRYPGSIHDSVIFQRRSLRIRYENNEIPEKILADNGYACKRYLLTPVINPRTAAEINYNVAHKQTRNIVERMIGIWKRRFPCLRRCLDTKVETYLAIICAVALLHHLARRGSDDIDEENNIQNIDHEEEGYVNYIIDHPNEDGILYRRAFINTHFANENI